MYQALYISPMIPSYNLAETGRFFTDVLDFTTVMDTAEYAIYGKDNLTVHLLRAGDDIGQMEFYMEVDNVDQLWASIRDRLQGIRSKEPFNQPYRMREIHLEVPHTKTLLMIGQEIEG